MKHIKVFDNKQLEIVILNVTDIWDNYGFTSFQKPFYTEQDAINWMINDCNEAQDTILNNDNINKNTKSKIRNMNLCDKESCEGFYYTMAELEGHDELETYISIDKDFIDTEEINSDVKIKLKAKQYNI